ncbi:hypothetical protein [Halogeometricum luteum]|uniref:Uncharacterized protein n=1 Tax=Halogeometricum luteum TaxID=2950537 RepID=A0ABU2G6Y8_9EURY|nr:hypothetical protein [Halogeometricum sp. S3BR5-2]MDS0296561.1 hypothetical protein [Halogeometricum sp. S3BR5-2]
MEDLDDEYEAHGRPAGEHRINDPPPFEKWADDLFNRTVGSPGGRDYGLYGRCEATAKSRGGRCRQPATGEHGKCYYHSGAPGTGVGEEQTDWKAAEKRARVRRRIREHVGHADDVDELAAD